MCWCEGDIPLHILPSFNIIDGAVIDYMHCLHEGIGKKLFQLWFTTSSNRYYIGQSIELISNHLTSVKPPDTITRTPCPLSTRKKWKGTIFNDSSIRTCPTCTTHLHSQTCKIWNYNINLLQLLNTEHGCSSTACQSWMAFFPQHTSSTLRY